MWGLILASILPIAFALAIGWILGKKYLSMQKLVGLIGYAIWLLLIIVGIEFGDILTNPHVGFGLIGQAFVYASIVSLLTFFCLLKKTQSIAVKANIKDILNPIKECVIAIAMVGIGAVLSLLVPKGYDIHSSYLLYFIIFLIGIDLSTVKILKITWRHVYVPCIAILVLIASAGLVSLIYPQSFKVWLMLGGGFGWFSLSGSLVAQLSNEEFGTVALLTDLFREFYAIILLYLYGKKQPNGVIGVCGATAMDSTLPFIKHNCSEEEVQIAIFSGFVLTVLAPFWIVLCATL
ncbi:lysine exporter LysO family protein [Acinetobacter sp. HY1485]|uniref:lysine exporter LysO family protein n=1 Tax=Acinetobacter sp. HY1485 TaxID=2970918 RepID=UPI0022B9AED0|nr:lysine exporter LysO family protein [Acinetobacter sp. HY1485]